MHNACRAVNPLHAPCTNAFRIVRDMDGKAQLRREQGARLREARIAAGYETATDAANAMGESVATYTLHENGGRGFKGVAEKYAKKFNVSPGWLLWGTAGSKTGERILRGLEQLPESERPFAEELLLNTLLTLARRPKPGA